MTLRTLSAVVGLSAALGVVTHSAGGVAPPAQAQAASGEALFTSKQCIKCHMVAGKGSKMSPLDGVGAKLSAADIRRWLTATAEMEKKLKTKPKVKMSTKIKEINLAPAEVDALVAYLLTLK
jgi:mono/diheme cytochrome c family protein